ncbi:MAG TPA: ABC transporter substrate-binding protein [Candidatus Limiplasma sp.]|jgi:branched-chain amino acid transport system substrate-binding protein|nr:ABC transporter substrate-binding protein [Candidatus Limiplasma sp.]
MKKIVAVILALALILSFSAVAMAENVIKIGVYEPASGDSGAGGKQETLGIQYANSVQPTVDIGGQTYNVQLVYADNGSSADKAPSAAQQLVSEGVSVVLGSYGSGVSIAGSPYFADAGIAAIGISCTNPQVTAGNTHYFRICFLDPFQGTVLANYAYKTLGVTNAYCLAELGNEYDVGLCHYFQVAFEALGGTVVSETFPTGNSDFTSYLNTATTLGAQVFFAPCSLSYSTQIVAQANALNVTYPLLGGDTWDSNKVVESAKGTKVKVYIDTFYQEGGNPEFDAGFKAWLNANPDMLTNNGGNDMVAAVSAMGYDAYFVALEAIKAAGTTDSKAINTAIWNVDYTGVSGEIKFADPGDAVRNVAYIKTANTETGAWDFVTVQSVE